GDRAVLGEPPVAALPDELEPREQALQVVHLLLLVLLETDDLGLRVLHEVGDEAGALRPAVRAVLLEVEADVELDDLDRARRRDALRGRGVLGLLAAGLLRPLRPLALCLAGALLPLRLGGLAGLDDLPLDPLAVLFLDVALDELVLLLG